MAQLDRFIGMLTKPGVQALTFKSGTSVEALVNGVPQKVGGGVAPTTEQILAIFSEVLPADFRSQAEGSSKDFRYDGPFGPLKVTVMIVNDKVSARLTPWTDSESNPSLSDRELTNSGPAVQPVAKTPVPERPSAAHGAPKIDGMFHKMLDLNASDLHLKSGQKPMVRVHGTMKPLDGFSALGSPDMWELLKPVMPESNRQQFEETFDTDFAYEVKGRARMRCNVFKDIGGVGAVFRQIPSKILTAKDLNLPQSILKLCDYSKGLVLVTGPTGSGKSTTLAALIDYVNEKRNAHIITIEDPVEFVHADKQCLINQREVYSTTKSFKAALRAALREDPDIILVGELRDLETTAIAIETAETGHLVFGTLHTNTAPSTVDRIIDQFPADRQGQIRAMLSESLIGVVAQTLCKRIAGGRIAALEILLTTSAVSNLIREGKTFQIPSMMQTSKNLGMQTLNDTLIDYVKQKIVAPDEAYMKSVSKKEMGLALTRAGFRGSWSEEKQ